MPIIGSLVKIEILQVCMLFIKESTNLNHSTFNEDSGYHVQYPPKSLATPLQILNFCNK
jgi:hypothetical protein